MFEFIQDNIYVFIGLIVLISSIFMRFILMIKKRIEKIEDLESLNKFLRPYGYAYDHNKDIFYTLIDAWQRDMGYTRLYDEAAAPAFMIIDCEPIYFEYDNKRWMIEFWKGQYGMVTGFEIGVYHTEGPDLSDEYSNWTFYDCADNDNMLKMNFTLLKDRKVIMKRKGIHWWLTGFKLGEFSQPWDLRANISITLKDMNMRDEFVQGLERAGYTKDELLIWDRTVSLIFDRPRTPQPFTRIDRFDEITQEKNRLLCVRFNDLTKDYDNSLDKVIALQEIAPEMLENILLMGKSKEIYNL